MAPETEVIESVDARDRLAQPPKYAVVLHNDDYTTMEFVVEVLIRFFHKSASEAAEITLRIHQIGYGLAGIYSFEIAETKALQVTEAARKKDFPLRCTVEAQ
ncbi:MAG: ATP-dependent Clp protease adaptor ClpS [Oligoflexia bacterium]|nr:ATP-dependent Clp protease adaptor ClpS [Oligoflexia bacterium]